MDTVRIGVTLSCARDGVAMPGHHRPDSWWTPQQGDALHPDATCSVAATAFSRRYQPGDNPNSPSAEYLCPAQLARAWRAYQGLGTSPPGARDAQQLDYSLGIPYLSNADSEPGPEARLRGFFLLCRPLFTRNARQLQYAKRVIL
jgi:hypothetical protein